MTATSTPGPGGTAGPYPSPQPPADPASAPPPPTNAAEYAARFGSSTQPVVVPDPPPVVVPDPPAALYGQPGYGQAQPGQAAQPVYDPAAYHQVAPGAPAPVAPPATEGTTIGPVALVQLAALLLVVVGLSLPLDRTAWVSTTAWAVFAAVAAVAQLAPVFRTAFGLAPERAWTIGAFAAAGLAVFWVLVAAPSAASNEGFFLTAGVAAAAFGCWRSPGSRWAA